MRSRAWISAWRMVAAGALLLAAERASAIYLDEDREVSLRARIYTQAAIRLSDSQTDTVPTTKAGQLVQHRNFYNPELEAKLTNYTRFLGPLAPDDFSFRIAAWGFYDGIYDYGSSQFNRQQRQLNRTYPDPNVSDRPGMPGFVPPSAFFLEGDRYCPGKTNPETGVCTNPAGGPFTDLNEIYPDHEPIRPRDIYGHEARVNELYLNYSNGPLFVRLGRQAISWGEADTIALLDQNNPFDISRGPPGAFQDLDEARIPLWTLRTSFSLFDALGPFSSAFVEAYWVPGFIDTTVGTLPVLTASPYSPRGRDPQEIINNLGLPLLVNFVLFDHVPEKKMSNSRYGFRFETVIARDHTFSIWYYTHFPSQPVPRSLGMTRFRRENGSTVSLFTTETVHKLTSVYGIADAFFLEAIDSIIRMEAEYFENEPGFVPEINLGATGDALGLLSHQGTVPVADIIRWELGLDRFFFFRPLNPTNSFTFVTAFVGAHNLDETGHKDFRFAGQRKPGARGESADHFVQLKEFELQGQIRLQTSYMHGKLEPGVTLIWNKRGTHAVLPEVNYRFTDYLIGQLKFIYIGGEYQQLGFYRDRDQVSLRMTYQLN